MSDLQIDKQTLLAIRKDGKQGGYAAARIDESGADKYYAFFNAKAEWYLMKITAAGSVLYYNIDRKGLTTAALVAALGTAWTDKATLTFREFPYVQLT